MVLRLYETLSIFQGVKGVCKDTSVTEKWGASPGYHLNTDKVSVLHTVPSPIKALDQPVDIWYSSKAAFYFHAGHEPT